MIHGFHEFQLLHTNLLSGFRNKFFSFWCFSSFLFSFFTLFTKKIILSLNCFSWKINVLHYLSKVNFSFPLISRRLYCYFAAFFRSKPSTFTLSTSKQNRYISLYTYNWKQNEGTFLFQKRWMILYISVVRT